MKHRILPRTQQEQQQTQHPVHRIEFLGALFFFAVFALFSTLILLSKLSPSILTGHAPNASTATIVNITPGTPFTCDHTFATGTTLVSFPCLPPIISRSDFLANLSQNGADVETIYAYTPSTNGKWKIYHPSLPNYTVQSLDTLDQLQGYYFTMAGNERLIYEGYLPKNTPISLGTGWNLVAYPTNETKSIASAIASISGSYEEVKELQGTEESGAYLVDTPPPGGETLTEMSLYHGYWIRMNTSAQWTVGP